MKAVFPMARKKKEADTSPLEELVRSLSGEMFLTEKTVDDSLSAIMSLREMKTCAKHKESLSLALYVLYHVPSLEVRQVLKKDVLVNGLPVYDESGSCPKCGKRGRDGGIETSWVGTHHTFLDTDLPARHFGSTTPAHEVIWRRCTRCFYDWLEVPLDLAFYQVEKVLDIAPDK